MASAPSPRPSVAAQTPTSARSSISIERQPANQAGSARRNRSALRDYYNLTTSNVAGSSEDTTPAPGTPQPETPTHLEAFDAPSFDAEAYVAKLLATEDLAGVLRVETQLVARIRGLDGEKKALVYDNYSKLIAATDTIRRMRGNMDPLAPMTKTLEPAIGEIVGRAERMSGELKANIKQDKGEQERQTAQRKQAIAQVALVRSVLDSPKKVEQLVRQGKRKEAELEWERSKKLLDSWGSTVKGVDEVRKLGESALASIPAAT